MTHLDKPGHVDRNAQPQRCAEGSTSRLPTVVLEQFRALLRSRNQAHNEEAGPVRDGEKRYRRSKREAKRNRERLRAGPAARHSPSNRHDVRILGNFDDVGYNVFSF